METNLMKEYWSFYEKANDLSELNILIDFVKVSSQEFYILESKGIKAEADNLNIFTEKYSLLKEKLDSLIEAVK